MSNVISVAQCKGGVGKTTLSISLAAELRRRGHDVALVDGDPQRSACQWAEPGKLTFPVYGIGLEDQDVAAWARHVKRVDFPTIIIDTAPSDRALGASIALADMVIVPCTPSGLDLESTARTIEIIEAVRARRHGRPRLILVPNRVDARTLEGRQLAEELAAFNETVSAPIGDRSVFVRAFSGGHAITDMPGAEVAQKEIETLCDLVEHALAPSPSPPPSE